MAMDKALIKIEEEVTQKRMAPHKVEEVQNYRFDCLVDQMVVEVRLEEALEYKWQRHIYNSEAKTVVKKYDRENDVFVPTLKEENR